MTSPIKTYFRRGKSKIYFLPTVADPDTGPTSAEITAGTDLSPAISAISGFSFANSPIATPNLAAAFTPQVPGEDTADNSTLTLNDSDSATDPIRTALTKGSDGFIILMPYGNTATRRCEVWPVTSTGVNDTWSVGNDPAQVEIAFAVTSPPNQSATLSA